MRPMRLVRSWLRASVLAAMLGVACTSPTLPLPPPALPTVGLGPTAGTFRLTSDRGALPNALVVSVNRNEALARDQRVSATLADENGSWDLTVTAVAGDVCDISQEDGSTRSPTTSVEIH